MVTTDIYQPDSSTNGDQILSSWIARVAAQYTVEERRKLSATAHTAALKVPQRLVVTGETQLCHNVATADILAQLNMDTETLQAAMLYGILDGDNLQLSELEKNVGPGVSKLVNSMARLDAVTTEQISQLTSANKVQTDQFEGLRRLLLGMVEDARAILVILAGRLHLLR
ncbi:hypothetical protein TI04_05475, partial [Achromatium sp. WMS2]